MKQIGQQTANIRWNSDEYDGECDVVPLIRPLNLVL